MAKKERKDGRQKEGCLDRPVSLVQSTELRQVRGLGEEMRGGAWVPTVRVESYVGGVARRIGLGSVFVYLPGLPCCGSLDGSVELHGL